MLIILSPPHEPVSLLLDSTYSNQCYHYHSRRYHLLPMKLRCSRYYLLHPDFLFDLRLNKPFHSDEKTPLEPTVSMKLLKSIYEFLSHQTQFMP